MPIKIIDKSSRSTVIEVHRVPTAELPIASAVAGMNQIALKADGTLLTRVDR